MSSTKSKAERIVDVQSNLPFPEDPPVSPDWNSAYARNVNVGSGGVGSDVSTGDGASSGLREPAQKAVACEKREVSIMSGVGRQGKNNLEDLPKDAKENR